MPLGIREIDPDGEILGVVSIADRSVSEREAVTRAKDRRRSRPDLVPGGDDASGPVGRGRDPLDVPLRVHSDGLAIDHGEDPACQDPEEAELADDGGEPAPLVAALILRASAPLVGLFVLALGGLRKDRGEFHLLLAVHSRRAPILRQFHARGPVILEMEASVDRARPGSVLDLAREPLRTAMLTLAVEASGPVGEDLQSVIFIEGEAPHEVDRHVPYGRVTGAGPTLGMLDLPHVLASTLDDASTVRCDGRTRADLHSRGGTRRSSRRGLDGRHPRQVDGGPCRSAVADHEGQAVETRPVPALEVHDPRVPQEALEQGEPSPDRVLVVLRLDGPGQGLDDPTATSGGVPADCGHGREPRASILDRLRCDHLVARHVYVRHEDLMMYPQAMTAELIKVYLADAWLPPKGPTSLDDVGDEVGVGPILRGEDLMELADVERRQAAGSRGPCVSCGRWLVATRHPGDLNCVDFGRRSAIV
ncbi:hypothetical protein [Sorangium sp. So ce1097]|uniref:hypothetical protein n=1 Tax=Sorangium sp. So ce1097 TaxID=3133330 RepID=UPI003F5DFF52